MKNMYIVLIYAALSVHLSESYFPTMLQQLRYKLPISTRVSYKSPFPTSKTIRIYKQTYLSPLIARDTLLNNAFRNLRDLVYGKYTYVNREFAPFSAAVNLENLNRFDKRYINAPFPKEPTFDKPWQVTNQTLIKRVIERTSNGPYTYNEQKEYVEKVLEMGADPEYDPAIEPTSLGYDRDYAGTAFEVATKLQNKGALAALNEYFAKQKKDNVPETQPVMA